MANLSAARWRKSSYSGNDSDNCVEIGRNVPALVPVRDSKDIERPALAFGVSAWSTFVEHVKDSA